MESAGLDGCRPSCLEHIFPHEVCTAPFIYSHANAYSLVSHYRNIKDDQIKACAQSGGLIGINGVNEYLGDDAASSSARFRHLDYIVNLVGARHVGIGLDYVRDVDAIWAWIQRERDLWPQNGSQPMPYPAHAQPEQLTDLVAMMVSHGYQLEDIRNILGGNFLRILRAAQLAAKP